MTTTKPVAGSVPARASADQLVERVVAADILAQRQHLAVGRAPGSGVGRAGGLLQVLVARQRHHRPLERSGLDLDAGRLAAHRAHRLGQALGAAQAAAGAPGQRAPAPLSRMKQRSVTFQLDRQAALGGAGQRDALAQVGGQDLGIEQVVGRIDECPPTAKPSAKSSRSAGEASITACEMPL